MTGAVANLRKLLSPRSLGGRLGLGLGLVALVGAAILLGLVALEYGVGADEPLTSGQLAREVADHVVAPLIVLLGLVAIAGTFVIRTALQPLARAAADVDDAAQTAPRGVRIDLSGFPEEARPFGGAVNRLLDRLEGAAGALDAFAADAAHELKTPLAILALELERLPSGLGAGLLDDVNALSRLVDQLLHLARLDAQAASEPPRDLVDPRAVAVEVVSTLVPIALKASRNLALEDRGGAAFAGWREAASSALRNLVENALRVTPEGGTVTVVVGPGARMSVHDEGPGLSDERLAELAQRGWRADGASPAGAGLGLAIVARIMAAHRGAFRADAANRGLILDFCSQKGAAS